MKTLSIREIKNYFHAHAENVKDDLLKDNSLRILNALKENNESDLNEYYQERGGYLDVYNEVVRKIDMIGEIEDVFGFLSTIDEYPLFPEQSVIMEQLFNIKLID